MGFGDEILALGRIEALYERTGKPHAILDRAMNPREHELWKGHPAWKKDAVDYIVDGPGARPYIKDFVSPKSNQQKIIFNLDYRARAGKICLTELEEAFCDIEGPFAIVSPHTKENASPNKQWGIQRWEEAIVKFPVPVYQLGPIGTHIIRGARHFVTPTMRLAASAVAKASVVMTNEGGLHHLSAAMGSPAVVVFGGFIPPSVTGYYLHTNLAANDDEGFCGSWTPCDHCKKVMDRITPDMVKQKAVSLL